MGLLRAETLAQRWLSSNSLPLRARLFSAYPRLLHGLWGYNALATLRDRLPGLSVLLAATLGIAKKRRLPRRAAIPYLRSHRESIENKQKGDVVLWVDSFSNFLDPDIPRAAVGVLHRGGYRVHVVQPEILDRPLCCGRTYLSQGQIQKARGEAERTIASLTPFLDKGWPIIGLEPSCLLMFRDEYHSLLPAAKAQKIASGAFLIEEFLAKEMDKGELDLPFRHMQGQRVLVHGHCHQKAFGALKPLRKILSRVPELSFEFIESSCCGMAGSFGMEQEHYEISMAMGELSLFPSLRSAETSAWILANGTSCRHQIAEGTSRKSRHVAEILMDCLTETSDPGMG